MSSAIIDLHERPHTWGARDMMESQYIPKLKGNTMGEKG